MVPLMVWRSQNIVGGQGYIGWSDADAQTHALVIRCGAAGRVTLLGLVLVDGPNTNIQWKAGATSGEGRTANMEGGKQEGRKRRKEIKQKISVFVRSYVLE